LLACLTLDLACRDNRPELFCNVTNHRFDDSSAVGGIRDLIAEPKGFLILVQYARSVDRVTRETRPNDGNAR